jgi:ATP-dependent DNA helicase DinG
MAAERNLYLTRSWTRPTGQVWLAIDLAGGDQIRQLDSLHTGPSDAPNAIITAPVSDPCAALPGGGLFLSEGVLWALVDPTRARLPVDSESADRIALELDLRRQAARFRRRLAWWQHLPATLRDNCRDLLRGFKPDLTILLDQLDRVPVILADEDEPGSEPDPAQPEVAVAPPSPDPEALYQWFTAPEGLGAIYGPEFVARPEQAEMAREVARALGQDDALLIEAGTGVGKTLAYLVPLLSRLIGEGGRAVVSTHTRALQTQILDLDLPRLRAILGTRKFALLMGRRNYLCLRQRLSFSTRPLENLQDALQAVAFRLWVNQTVTGMREELAGHHLLDSELGALFDAADLCLPGQCYEGGRCFVQKARQGAREADLLVVNHSLLMHDLLAENTLLGEFGHLVVDEAHRLPAVVLDTHGVAVGPWRLDEVEELLGKARGQSGAYQRVGLVANRLQALGKDGLAAASACEDFSTACTRVFKSFRGWWKALAERVDEVLPGTGQRLGRVRVRDKDEAFGQMRSQTVTLLENLAEAGEAFAAVARRTGVLDELSSGLEDDLAQIGQAGQLLRSLYLDVKFLTSDPDEDWVTWIDPGPTRGVRRLGATLLEAGGVLRDYWQQGDKAPIMTSATLAVGEDFTHMMSELGLTRRRPPAVTFTCPSPFDYHQQVRILTPSHFPAPGAGDFSRHVGEVMAELGHRIPRKTLGLFTSYRMISEVEQVMEHAGLAIGGGVTPGGGMPVFSQHPGTSPGHLMERFRQAPRAVLLGTSTFWEGVDFPGQDLEILVVAKLPFLVPNDPWVEARCERVAAAGDNPFTAFMVRDAVLRLRQGIGRLIRRIGDKGVVILLDNRLHTKNYGVTFLSALPVVPDTFSDSGDLLDRLEDFFNQR